ncbi:leucyl aminopeptidase, partial [Kocuria sp. HSID17582]
MTTPQEILATHEVQLTVTTKPLGGTPADALVLGVSHDGAVAVPGDVKGGVRRRLNELAERAGARGRL